MKKFRLLKDHPYADAGSIVNTYNRGDWGTPPEGQLILITHNDGRISIPIEKQSEWLEEITEKKRWRAEEGDMYWCVRDDGGIGLRRDNRYYVDNHRYLTHNYYETEEEVQKALDRQIAITKLNDIIDEVNEDWEGDNSNDAEYYIIYDCFDSKYDTILKLKQNYFPAFLDSIKNKEIAEKIIEEHKDLLDIVFEV